MRTASCVLAGIVALHFVATTRAADPNPDRQLVENVNNSIEKARRYLRSSQKKDNWDSQGGRAGGVSSLAMLALLSAGEKPTSEVIQNGLKYLRSVNNRVTYVVSLQTMVYAAVGEKQDMQRIRDNVDWLLKARKDGGWGYSDSDGNWVDYSNTQYALLGLHEAIQAGVKIERKDLEWIRKIYINSQNASGGWSYKPDMGQAGNSLTMTVAGACGLLITGMDLNAGRETIADGKVKKCGVYEEQRPLAKALEWIGTNPRQSFPAEARDIGTLPHVYYSLYGIERLGRLSGQRFLGGKDWYRIGCEYLIGGQCQRPDGSWSLGDGEENGPITCTSFALLFLSKGRTPVLISKLAHDIDMDGNDWNNDRYDVRNLVEFTRKELFKQPLAWQVFDPRFIEGDDNGTVKRLAEELLQTPMVVITGHEDPHLATSTGNLTRNGKILKEFVENGGFIYIEACCGDERFHKQLDNQLNSLFRGAKLEELVESHPVWAASNKWTSSPKDFKLYGIQLGCRTPLIYSKDNLLCCRWEENETEGAGQKAFQMGANIIAYATGLTPPPERGTKMHVTDVDAKGPPPGSFKIAQIMHGKDAMPAPHAVRNLMLALRAAGLKDVDLEAKQLYLDTEKSKELFADYKFLYMHGRTPIQQYDKDDLASLRFSLETHGLLLGDACCGSKVFDESFRKFVKDLFPDKKLEPIPLDDPLFSAKLNGEKIEKVRCRRSTDNKDADTSYPLVEPELEGIKIGNRWAIIYSKYDIGCALEKNKASNCLGHDHESAKRLAMAAALYALRP